MRRAECVLLKKSIAGDFAPSICSHKMKKIIHLMPFTYIFPTLIENTTSKGQRQQFSGITCHFSEESFIGYKNIADKPAAAESLQIIGVEGLNFFFPRASFSSEFHHKSILAGSLFFGYLKN